MARKRVYATALIAAFATFAVTGGIRASEHAATVVEHEHGIVAPVVPGKDARPAAKG